MHYLLEIILPNDTKDIKNAVEQIMNPFSENREDDENHSGYSFWDWYVIGGRWAGQKLISTFDKEKVDKFYRLLNQHGITVSSITCGKQEIKPEDQIPFVDDLWNELFPENDGRPCPIFNHSNNQYDKYGIICGDIMPVKECLDFDCGHVIIASLHDYNGKYPSEFVADYMVKDSIWNGVIHQNTDFKGCVGEAIRMFKDHIKNYNPDYIKKFENIENWLSITIDYHS